MTRELRCALAAGAIAVTSLVVIAPAAGAVPGDDGCPGGKWETQVVSPSDVFDANGDGIICTLMLPGQGEGNSANSQRRGGQIGVHVDGHNHKDNNNPS